jgi:endonuclease/exonuclease/phosphatase family metal-dependent hydrolase
VLAPNEPHREAGPDGVLEVATYNVHRFAGPGAGNKWVPELAGDVIPSSGRRDALQEVLRPFEEPDPLPQLRTTSGSIWRSSRPASTARASGNAILSRWPLTSVFALDLSFSASSSARRSPQFARDESRVWCCHPPGAGRPHAPAAGPRAAGPPAAAGPTVLLGDMNVAALPATRRLETS